MMKLFSSRGKETADQSSSQSPSFSPSSTSSPSASPVTGPARPIRLVYCDENGQFRMDPEAVATLQLVKEPIGVVSVCGRARQGKSFILNQLLGRSSGFQVASTHRPCTKGLWLWSAPIKKTAIDGTDYNLLLLDSEGIDAYDQTGTYSIQIFSLAVLLSSMFIYNQMGGIDEAALDSLSLVTQMTKHIRVKASGVGSTASELGQFSPIFVWLLRDFYLNLVEDNRRITPRDYLELALQPVQGIQKDIASKNEIRDSIRVLFPDRECFTLVRPLNSEHDLQRLDQISLGKLRPEFRAGLDALTEFVFERTRPKQLGATVMTGPILVGITESYLEALNKGAVPTISSSWQSVEEGECRKAFDSATETYMSSFDRSKPIEELALREAHDEAVQKSLAVFDASVVGVGSARKKYEGLLHKFFKKAFEDYKKNAFMEADLQCSNAIHSMEKRLRAACLASDAKIDNVVKVLDALVLEYQASCQGIGKWQKLATFLQQSLEGPVFDLAKRLVDRVGSEKSSLMLKCRSIEDKMKVFTQQLEASEKYKSEYLKRYDDAINEKNKLAADYVNRITNLQSTSSSLSERCSSLIKQLDSAKHDTNDWKRKHDSVLSNQKAEKDRDNSEIALLKSRSSAAEARLVAAQEQVNSACEESYEWKKKYDLAVREAKSALEKAAVIQKHANMQTQHREDALREEFCISVAEKEDELKDKLTKLEHAEQRLTTLRMELEASMSNIKSYDSEMSSLKLKIKELGENLETVNGRAQSFERETRMLEQEKINLEQKYQSEFKRFDEVQERCKIAERESKKSIKSVERARFEVISAQKDKSEIQILAIERLTEIEHSNRNIEKLQRERADLAYELDNVRLSEMNVKSKVSLLEARVEEREKEIESLLKSNNEERATNVKVLENLLEEERASHSIANHRAETLSIHLQEAQTKLDTLQQELTTVRLNETALDSKLKTSSHGKRQRQHEYEDMDIDEKNLRANKRPRSTMTPLKKKLPEDGCSVCMDDVDTVSSIGDRDDYTKFTVQKLKQELTKYNFGAELLELRNPNKKDVVALYEKCVLKK